MNTQNTQNTQDTQDTALAERTTFLLPDVAATETGFTKEELAGDIDGLQLGFQRVKIPSGGQVQFELPGEDPDNPDYSRTLEGVIVYSHNANAYWPTGEDYDDNTPPSCQSTDGKLGYGAPGGLCADCPYNRYGSDTKGTGRGKACKNQRIIYLLRSGEAIPIQLSLSPTSITPYTQFVNAAFVARRRGICGSVVQIGLKKKNNGKDDYSVATFKRLYDFTGDELAKIRAYADSFKEQIELILEQRAENIEAEAGSVEMERPTQVMPENADHFEIGSEIDGGRSELPL